MKFLSWNVNGLRACLAKGDFDFCARSGADVVCLGETKMQRGQAEIPLAGFHEYWNSAEKKGYSGTAVFSKVPAISERYGIGIPEHDKEGRVITLEFERFFLVNVYTPNSQGELARLPYRMKWEDDFRAYLKGLDVLKPVIVCGDLNVAHTEMDIKNAKSNERNAGFTAEERGKMDELLSAGFTDTYRLLHPDKRDGYTWWSYRANARERNIGWRIDYFLVSDRLRSNIRAAEMYPDVYGSDHCPVWLELDMPES